MIAFAALVVAIAVLCYPICDNDKVLYSEGYSVILYHLGLTDYVPAHLTDFIYWETLLPRAFAAVFVGGLLGLVGTVMQQVLANPLADPYTTGISSGAGLGAVLMIVLGISIVPGVTGMQGMILNAFLMALVPIAVIVLINRFRKVTTAEIILIGVGLMFFFGAANTIVILMADPNDLQGAFTWGLGNLGMVNWDNIPVIVGASAGASVFFMLLCEKVKVLVNRDEITRTLGENPSRLRSVILVVISFAIACVVSFTGTIGFVGLVAPHVVRLFLGTELRVLLPASFLSGALIMTLSDVLARMIALPVGVVTSVLGGTIFLLILIKQNKKENL